MTFAYLNTPAMSSSVAVTVTVWVSFQFVVVKVRLDLSTVATPDFLVHEAPVPPWQLAVSSRAVTVIVTAAVGCVSSTTV